MIGFNKLFFDTSSFIYLLENHPTYSSRVSTLIQSIIVNGGEITTSVISHLEFCVKPEQEGRIDLIQSFEELLQDLEIEMLDIDKRITTIAYKLRAKYSFLKGMDSIQIGAAIFAACDGFVTNDFKLKRVSDIQMVIIDEL